METSSLEYREFPGGPKFINKKIIRGNVHEFDH